MIISLEQAIVLIERGANQERFRAPMNRVDVLEAFVPKVLHFIWIGSTLPDRYRANVESYVVQNPAYEIVLWVDTPCDPIVGVKLRRVDDVLMQHRSIYDSATNIGLKADILRYEIVYALGGVYTDIDSRCLKPFGDILTAPFVVVHEPQHQCLTNAVFGFHKQSSFLRFLLDCLPENYENYTDIPAKTGPPFFTSCFLSYADSSVTIFDHLSFLPNTSRGDGVGAAFTIHTNDANWTRDLPVELTNRPYRLTFLSERKPDVDFRADVVVSSDTFPLGCTSNQMIGWGLWRELSKLKHVTLSYQDCEPAGGRDRSNEEQITAWRTSIAGMPESDFALLHSYVPGSIFGEMDTLRRKTSRKILWVSEDIFPGMDHCFTFLPGGEQVHLPCLKDLVSENRGARIAGSVLIDHSYNPDVFPGGSSHVWTSRIYEWLANSGRVVGQLVRPDQDRSDVPDWVERIPPCSYVEYLRRTSKFENFVLTHPESYGHSIIDMVARGIRVLTPIMDGRTFAPADVRHRLNLPTFVTREELTQQLNEPHDGRDEKIDQCTGMPELARRIDAYCQQQMTVPDGDNDSFFRAYAHGGPGSGVGSSVDFTIPLRAYLDRFLDREKIRSVVDYGCGDWQWAQYVAWGERSYLGIDIVPSLIDRLNQQYGSDCRRFVQANLAGDWTSDLVICKDVCIHLPNHEISSLVQTLASKSKHILWINTVKPTPWLPSVNAQIKRGECRPVDLLLAPFGVQGEHEFFFGDGGDGGWKSVFHQRGCL